MHFHNFKHKEALKLTAPPDGILHSTPLAIGLATLCHVSMTGSARLCYVSMTRRPPPQQLLVLGGDGALGGRAAPVVL